MSLFMFRNAQTVLGAGILGTSIAGLLASALGLHYPLAAQMASALVAMCLTGYFVAAPCQREK